MPEEEKESEDPALGSGGRQRKEQVSNRIKKSFFLRAIIKVGIIAGVSVFLKYFWSCLSKGNRSYKV